MHEQFVPRFWTLVIRNDKNLKRQFDGTRYNARPWRGIKTVQKSVTDFILSRPLTGILKLLNYMSASIDRSRGTLYVRNTLSIHTRGIIVIVKVVNFRTYSYMRVAATMLAIIMPAVIIYCRV